MTTFERIGGKAAITLIVDKFFDLILADKKTAHFF
jgi:truncated hemoglobin YjbI